MTTTNHLVPPPELVTSLRNSAPHGIRDAGVTRELWLINHAYAAGADQELEACIEWLLQKQIFSKDAGYLATLLAARRPSPKPPSLKERALAALEVIPKLVGFESERDTIRRALEALDD
jgi:hypothetical protein